MLEEEDRLLLREEVDETESLELDLELDLLLLFLFFGLDL
jgi:hypothetical protein